MRQKIYESDKRGIKIYIDVPELRGLKEFHVYVYEIETGNEYEMKEMRRRTEEDPRSASGIRFVYEIVTESKIFEIQKWVKDTINFYSNHRRAFLNLCKYLKEIEEAGAEIVALACWGRYRYDEVAHVEVDVRCQRCKKIVTRSNTSGYFERKVYRSNGAMVSKVKNWLENHKCICEK